MKLNREGINLKGMTRATFTASQLLFVTAAANTNGIWVEYVELSNSDSHVELNTHAAGTISQEAIVSLYSPYSQNITMKHIFVPPGKPLSYVNNSIAQMNIAYKVL